MLLYLGLEARPEMKMLNRFVTDMAPKYYGIGLELDIKNEQLKVIQSDPNLHNSEDKCREMLDLWLKNDTSATWSKLCNALEELKQSVLAKNIRDRILQM